MTRYEDGICYISGRIDTNHASTLEQEIREGQPGRELTLDFTDVSYISSSGLRVILRLLKDGRKVSVVNVSPEVYEIFETTGFVDLCSVTKRLREVSIEGCEVIGQGANGTVYRFTDDQILKLYRPGIRMGDVQEEQRRARVGFVQGMPTAIPFDIVKCGDRLGTVFELMDALTLGKAFTLYPERYEELIGKYADLVRLVREIRVPEGSLPHVKDVLSEQMGRMKGLMSDDAVDAMLRLIDAMPAGETLVHGDLHTGNIMLQGDELMIIDMADIAVGPPQYEILCMYRDLKMQFEHETNRAAAEASLSMSMELSARVWQDVFANLMGTRDEAVLKSREGLLSLLSVAQAIPNTAGMPPQQLAFLAPMIEEHLYTGVVAPHYEAVLQGMQSL